MCTESPTGAPSTPSPTSETSDDHKFVASIVVAIPIFLIFLIWFLICRRKYPQIYMTNQIKAKESGADQQEPKVTEQSQDDQMPTDDGVLSLKMFDVLVEIFTCDEEKIQAIAGFDAMTFTSLLWFQCKLFLLLMPIGCFLLMPVYGSGPYSGDFLDMISLSNVGSSDTWKTIFTLFVALGIHIGATKYLCHMMERLSYKADQFKAIPTEGHCTVMIQNIDEELMEGNKLVEFLEDLYPGQICNVDVCKDLSQVQKLWETYQKAEESRKLCEQSETKTLGFGCLKKDLEHFKNVEAEAKEEFYQVDITSVPNIPVAVVQFDSVKTATSCASSVLVPGGYKTMVSAVPEFADQIRWTNLGATSLRKDVGYILSTTLYILLIIFYTPLMVTVQGLANLDNLANIWSGFETLTDSLSTEAEALIQGTLPAIVYSIFFAVLPMYLNFLSGLCKMPFGKDEDCMTLTRYADCLVGMGLLVSVFASGILSSIDALNNLSPEEIWTQLGEEVPAQSLFFITYVITACFISLAMNMALLVPFILNILGMYAPAAFNYTAAYGVNIMMFTVCVTYAVVSPLILVWGFCYFAVAYFTYTYQLIYVFKRSNDTGGASFPGIYGRLNNGMIIGQLVIIAMFVLVDSIACATLFLSAIIYTIATKYSARKYAHYFESTSVSSAIKYGTAKTNIVTKGENNFIAPAVKALIKWREGNEEIDDQKDSSVLVVDQVPKQRADVDEEPSESKQGLKVDAPNEENKSDEQVQESDDNASKEEKKSEEQVQEEKVLESDGNTPNEEKKSEEQDQESDGNDENRDKIETEDTPKNNIEMSNM